MKKAILYFAFLSLFMSMKCEDELVPQGTQVHVHGRMYDPWNEQPVVNHKLIISEFNLNGGFNPDAVHLDYIGVLDSVYTNENGYYDLTFTTSGRGDTYYIDYEENDYLWSYGSNHVELDVTISNQVDFNTVYLYPATLKITTAPDLNYLPIYISHHYTIGELEKIDQAGTENIRPIVIDKNSPVEIKFYRNLPDGDSQQAVFEFPATNTTEPTEFEIHLDNDDFE